MATKETQKFLVEIFAWTKASFAQLEQDARKTKASIFSQVIVRIKFSAAVMRWYFHPELAQDYFLRCDHKMRTVKWIKHDRT
jgi:hypothetical protein